MTVGPKADNVSIHLLNDRLLELQDRMGRPSQTDERRKELLPVVAKAFSELGYRRTTTAELAQRCVVQENILYRLWDDKKAMFLAAIQFLYQKRIDTWQELLRDNSAAGSVAERLVEYEVHHLGEGSMYRIIFLGLGETDDPAIRNALRQMYKHYQKFIADEVRKHRETLGVDNVPSEDDSAWTLIGLVTVLNILIEFELMSSRRRGQLFLEMSRFLLDGIKK